MVAAAALGDVVQQRRDVERAAAGELGDRSRSRSGWSSRSSPLLDLREQADRADGVLVDRVVVVHVELHLRVDPAEIGHEAAEHARLVHPPQRGLGVVAAGQQLRGTARWRADRCAPRPRSAARRARAMRIVSGWISSPSLLGELEQLDQPHRVLAEPVVAGRADLAADDPVALEHRAARLRKPASSPRGRRLLANLLVDVGEEHAGQVADVLAPAGSRYCMNRSTALLPGRSAKSIRARDLALEVEGQPVLGAPGDRVQVAAHRQQEALGAAEAAVFLGA